MANARKGEYLLELPVGHNGSAGVKAFTVRLTFNGLCDVLQALSLVYGRDFTVRDVNSTIATGFLNYVVLRELFFVSVKGQHGVYTPEDAGNVLEESADMIFKIATALARAFNELMPPVDAVKGLSEALREEGGGAPDEAAENGESAGNPAAPSGAMSSASAIAS